MNAVQKSPYALPFRFQFFSSTGNPMRATGGILGAIFSVLMGIYPSSAEVVSGLEKGAVLVASCEGLSVWDREGVTSFQKYFHSGTAEKAAVVPWSDMIYDACRLASGNYLCAAHEWVREVNPSGSVVWEYRVQKPVELKTCVPLPNGDVMTVDGERMELIQLTDQGRRVARRIPVPTDAKAAVHVRYNLLRRTSAGTWLVALRSEKAFVEIDESGKELWRHAVPDLPVVAERLQNGNTLMSWRGGLQEVAPDHRMVWELKAADVKEFSVVLFGGFQRLANGNTVIVNSDWHRKEAGDNRVQVWEVDREKRVVWKLGVDAFEGKKPGCHEPRTGLVEHRLIGLQWLGGESP
jgi:hypothetical protein